MITPSFSLTATERVLPKLALDFTTANLDSRVTFTRTTGASNPATYVNSSGYVTSATNNQPRFGYNPVTLDCKGLLIEESRQNLCLYSQDFTTGWTYTTPYSVVNDSAISPDGTQNADLLLPDSGASSFNGNVPKQTITKAASAITVTHSGFYKSSGGNVKAVRINDLGNPVTNNATVTISLVDGSVLGAPTVAGTFTNPSVVVENYGNGWWRVALTYTTDTSTSLILRAFPYSGASSFTGDGVNGLLAWGIQLEAGAFATSYIPTEATALTRNADVATMTGTNFSDWFNASEGTLYASYTNGGDTTSTRVFVLSSSADTDLIQITGGNSTGTTGPNGFVSVSGSAQANMNDGAPLANTSYTAVLAYKENSFAFAKNGGTIKTDPLGTIPTVDRAGIGYAPGLGTQQLNGWIAKLMYWPQRLTNNEVQAFSKG